MQCAVHRRPRSKFHLTSCINEYIFGSQISITVFVVGACVCVCVCVCVRACVCVCVCVCVLPTLSLATLINVVNRNEH